MQTDPILGLLNRQSELSSVPLTKTVLHPEPLFGYWHNSCYLAIVPEGGSRLAPPSQGNLSYKS